MIFFRLVKRLFLLLFIVFLISFGFSNKELLFLNLWPFKLKLEIPAYLFFFISLSIGVIIANIYSLLKKKNDN